MTGGNLLRDIQLGVENLLLHKLRTLLTMLGIVFGVGSVVAMLSVGEGASRNALAQIRKVGSNNIIIDSRKPLEEGVASNVRKFMSVYGLGYADHRRIAETFDKVERVVPAKITRKMSRLGERSLELRVVGTTPEWFDLIRRDFVAGRRLRPADAAGEIRACVLTEFGARKLLATEHSIGQEIRIGDSIFTVVGIVKSESGAAGTIRMPDDKVDVYIPINVFRSHFGDVFVRRTSGSRQMEQVELHRIIVAVRDIGEVEATASGLTVMLEKFHPRKDYEIAVPLAILRQAEATKRTFNIVLGSIACISLLVGGIGIMNIMLASVTERTREIGIRRAIGARRDQVIRQFIIETVVLSSAGGVAGIGLGIFIPWLITRFTGLPTVVTAQSIFVSVVISIGCGIVFGLYPAMRAAEVDPIVALRHE